MNVLITGASGFIGYHLVDALCNRDEVHVLLRPASKYVPSARVKVFVFEDNRDELGDYLRKHKIEGIVHLASLFVAQHQSSQIKDMVLSNIYLGTVLLEAASTAGVQWFLNTGTYWQHYVNDSKDYCPVNLYAASKQAFVDMAAYYTETSGLRFVSLKIADTFGIGDTRRKLFTILKEIAVSGEKLAMSPGDQLLDILYIDDVVAGFMHLMQLLHKKQIIENEYILAAKQRYTLKEIAALYEKVSGKKLAISWGGKPYRKREVMCPWIQGTPLPGWEAKLSLEEGIKKIINEN